MEYLITFLEGIISFVSPCMLPILPIYISCFAGKSGKKSTTFFTAASFVAGFTLIFCTLGLFAGSIGSLLHEYHTAIDIVSGIIIVLLGLNFLGLIKIPFFKDSHHHQEV
ncbi:MAG: cytochrome c biogenesis protein CcdA, partial [Clostridia bacterium]|nr:cytochrome c biogenesis protein CcdA [Clostridia bacterium]